MAQLRLAEASLAYSAGQYAITPMTYATSPDGSHHLVIEPTKGEFEGQVHARSYELRIHATDKRRRYLPTAGTSAGGWDAEQATATITLPRQTIRDGLSVVWH